MMIVFAVIVYASALIVANLTVAAWGPWVSPINAFLLIGLDLALRDWLHVRVKTWQMGTLILCTGLLTYALNPASGTIAIASATAFSAAALVDWMAFSMLRGSWLFRANGSNIAGAAVDSFLFPTIAFGVLMPEIIVLQFISKTIGGYIFSIALSKTVGRNSLVVVDD